MAFLLGPGLCVEIVETGADAKRKNAPPPQIVWPLPGNKFEANEEQALEEH
jgi:hypothetical protein